MSYQPIIDIKGKIIFSNLMFIEVDLSTFPDVL